MFQQFVTSQFPWKPLFWNLLFSLNPGDQIAVEGQFGNINYYHHGIFISYEDGIIEYGGSKKMYGAAVRNVSLNQFTDGRKQLKIIKHTRFYHPRDVVAIAIHFYEKETWNGPYDIFRNNCEHFATFCKTGILESKQVQDYICKHFRISC